jgi:S-adenosylmethionine:tRNA ribosyltransferase-isomerase
MLVCAFAGTDFVMKAYKKAQKDNYKFLSYGDAMLLL